MEYKLELYGQLKEMGFNVKNLIEYTESVADFLLTMDEQIIQSRIGALESILEGLTLGGRIDLRDFFFDRRLQIMQETVLASKLLSSEMVIAHLKGRVFANDTVNSSEALNPVQKQFVEQTLPLIIRKKEKQDERYLKDFLKHVTGLPFINQERPDITVAFDKTHKLSWPRVWTCQQMISVPLHAYDNDEGKVKDLLDQAMAHSANNFDMN